MAEAGALLEAIGAPAQWPLWVLIDASGLERGREDIHDEGFEELECLFTGDLAVELADVAPYLGQIEQGSEQARATLDKLIARDCAVLLVGPSDRALRFADLHRHLRKFNVVYGPDGQALFFRYFDGRALPGVLEALDAPQLVAFFGPLARIVVPTTTDAATDYTLVDSQLTRSALPR